MKRIIKTIIVITIVMIPNVKAITSDQVLYGDKTVTEALDELNMCATSGDATAGSILSGKTAYVQGKLVTGTIPTLATTAQSGSLGHVDSSTPVQYGKLTSGDTTAYVYLGIPRNTYTGNNDFIRASESDVASAIGLTGAKIVPGNSILGVSSTVANKTAATYTPGTSNQTISAGQYLSGAQTIAGDANLKASNIACGVTIFGVKGTKGCSLATKAKVGDYVSMIPDSNLYTISANLTGCGGDAAIIPSELNLWRIIRINVDGTIEMVSEYTSSRGVYFCGQAGFLNFTGALNAIASAYSNSNYTIATRHVGYGGQPLFGNVDRYGMVNPARWPRIWSDVDFAIDKGSDGYYGFTDASLLNAALNTTVAKDVLTKNPAEYWFAGREYMYHDQNNYFWQGSYITTAGGVSAKMLYNFTESWNDVAAIGMVRPIVTLKPTVNASSGSGTSASPWVLS